MNINEIISKAEKPKIYEKGSSFMWTDAHISAQLLDIHLNPDIDLASRKKSSIQRTTDWILNTQKQNKKLNILDLGCGPGLYTEIFAKAGHHVTGMDISKNSIEHAKQSAENQNLDITYIQANYLETELASEHYDLVLMIFTDFGVLNPDQRGILLDKVYRVLKKGGTFIFDVLKDRDIDQKTAPKTWEAGDKGFWRNSPYLALSDSFLYEEEKVILFQHIIIDQNDKLEIYRFWTHFFSQNDIEKLLDMHNFREVQFKENVLPEGDKWNGDNVIFTRALK